MTGFSDPMCTQSTRGVTRCNCFASPAIGLEGVEIYKNTTAIYTIVANLQPLDIFSGFFMHEKGGWT